MSFIVAIDGPAGSGKGTITKLVGKKLGLIYIDTGATFRCVALNILQEGINWQKETEITEMLNQITIEIKENGEVFLNGKEVTQKIRENEVTNLVSQISVLQTDRKSVV